MFPFVVAGLMACNTAVRAQPELDGFDSQTNGAVRVIVVQPDRKILIGGSFTAISPEGGAPVKRNHIARLNTDGTVDMAFNPDANIDVEAIALETDGRILVGGQFTSIGGARRKHIARLDPITGLADSFDPDANERVYFIAFQADGKILVGGVFDSIGGEKRNHIARLDPITGLADSFDPTPDGFGVYAIVIQLDGKILAGGSFGNIGGQARNSIARLDPRTGLADSFDPHPVGEGKPFAVCYAIALQADGKILAGGDFRSIGGQPRNRIVRLDAETGLADSFNPNASGGDSHPDISAIVVQLDGRIIVGGAFREIGGEKRNHIARLDAITGLADGFDPSPDALGIYTIALQIDGKILAGGSFDSIAGQDRSYFARVTNDVTARQ